MSCLSTEDIYEYCSFGWTNASYVYGLEILPLRARRALAVLAPWEVCCKGGTVGLDAGSVPKAENAR
jgi:hypothetical protein